MCLKMISFTLVLGFISIAHGKYLSAWEGDEVELHCLPRTRPGMDGPMDWKEMVMWEFYKDEYPLRIIKDTDGKVDQRNFSRPYVYDPESHSLFVDDVTKNDSTKYTCSLDNRHLYASEEQLDVYTRPTIDVNQVEMHLAESGEKTKAACKVTNMHKHFDYEVNWTGNLEGNVSEPEVAVHEDDSNLFDTTIFYTVDTVQQITKSDLTCNLKIKNWNGSAGVENYLDNDSMKLQVIMAPVFKHEWNQVETLVIGRPRKFRCSAKGSEDITYRWERNGEEVKEGVHVTIDVKSMDEHGDVYKCIATNIRGKVETGFELDVQGKPSFELSEEVVAVEPSETTKKIVCTANSNPRPDEFSWTVEGSELSLTHEEDEGMQTSTATLKRSDLKEDEENRITCTVRNEHGSQSKTFRVNLKASSAMSGGMVVLVVFLILFLFGVMAGGVLIMKRRSQAQQQGLDVEQSCAGLLCAKTVPEKDGNEEGGEVGPADNDEVKEEVDEEKQNLTEKNNENDDAGEEKTQEVGEEDAMLEKKDEDAPKKKKLRLRGPLACCKKNRKQLQEDEDAEENKVNEEDESDPSDEKSKDEKQDESDRDSGKGDTLKPNTEAPETSVDK